MQIFSAILQSIVGKTITLFIRGDYIRLILYDSNDFDTAMTNNGGQRIVHYKLQKRFTVRGSFIRTVKNVLRKMATFSRLRDVEQVILWW